MKIKRIVIDRIESGIAILEIKNGKMAEVSVSELPEGAKPGDWLIFENGTYFIDEKSAEEARKRIQKLMDGVWKD